MKQSKKVQEIKNKAKNGDVELYERKLVKEVVSDYENRKNERKPFELSWELNMNFMAGNQFVYISPSGTVEDVSKNYYWENRDVFNHIVPIIETRLAKLGRVRPTMFVRPSGQENKDSYSAKLGKAIIDSVWMKYDVSSLIGDATAWSEITGTSFYKIIWNNDIGNYCAEIDGKMIKSGDVEISVCPSFEVFPDSTGSENLDNCESLIHARVYPAEYVSSNWGTEIKGEEIDIYSFDNVTSNLGTFGVSNVLKVTKSTKKNHSLVIEKYTKPTLSMPNGRLTIVAGGKLLFDGDMPFILSENGERGYPFVRQVSNKQVGCFWGSSVIERCIPIQRAYNAIKNRKHEFLNRLSSGVLAVEDGSVDIDNLEQEGLAPGKILVYRTGSSIPRFMDSGDIPSEFNHEEDRLLSEFITISGVSEIMRNSSLPGSVSSGTAINLLIEQDDTRLSVTAENIRNAVREIGCKILRLYKQFATSRQLARTIDENGDVEIFYWQNSDIDSDDVVLETTNELSETPNQRKSMVVEILKYGLLHDENGKISNRMRVKVLEALGFGNWESTKDIEALHVKKANRESLWPDKNMFPSEIDDHQIHIDEHTKFILSSENLSEEVVQILNGHIKRHKQLLMAESEEFNNNLKNLNIR